MSAACPVFGFVVRLRLDADGDVAVVVSALQRDLLEKRGLVGVIGPRRREVVISGEAAQATDADRDAVVTWLEKRAEVEWFEASALCDIGSAA